MGNNRLILGTRKGLIVLSEAHGRWSREVEAFPGIPVSYAAEDPRTGALWALADHGHWGAKLHRSDDGGHTLREIPAPAYPEGAVTYDIWNAGAELPAKVSYMWTIVPGGTDQPGRLYIGTEPGGVFVSDDDGETWALNEGLWNHPSRREHWFGGGRDLPGACSIIVDPRDSDHLFVGVSVGGVFESTDGGRTWEGRNQGLRADFLPDPYAAYGHDPHCTVASPSNPDVLWQQNHCGVFRSVDAGRTWTDISTADGRFRFGFPIVADPHDEQTAWVVPGISDEQRMAVGGALMVGRTADGGRTWTALRDGLPQENVYDIVFRHALDLAGDRLAFGTTTGNVFLSVDRGDSWQCLGNHFPPLYSVRFGETR